MLTSSHLGTPSCMQTLPELGNFARSRSPQLLDKVGECFGGCMGSRKSLLVKRRTRDQKVASSNPGCSGGIIFFSRVYFFVLTLIRCPFHPRVTAVARERLQSFCQKCRWQVTPKHAYTLDPTKSEWADYAAVQAKCGNLRKRSHMQLVREHSATFVSVR